MPWTRRARIFAAGSRRLLDHLAGNSPRLLREITIILAACLLRAARQDWYEQGDCWEQMAGHRRDVHGSVLEPDAGTVSAMLALLAAVACQAVFGSQSAAGTPLNPGGRPGAPAVSAVTTTTDSTDENRAAQLRSPLMAADQPGHHPNYGRPSTH